MNYVQKFTSLYGVDPSDEVFAPYRLCPLGAHTDHNLGLITGFAIDKGIRFAFSADESGKIEATSVHFPTTEKWSTHDIPATKCGDWADYLRGVTLALSKRHPLSIGLKTVMQGELPIGGLSSSAAVTLGFLTCLCRVNGIRLRDEEKIELAHEAESRYVGVSCGKLDQSCEVYGKANHLLFMDMKDGSKEWIAQPDTMKPYRIAVFFSGVERSLVGSQYNMRVDEAKSAAYALKAFAALPYGKFNETVLRDVPADIFERYKDRLPEPWLPHPSPNRRQLKA